MKQANTAGIIDELLPAEMLRRFRERAARYDAENVFFTEDLVELRTTGYLAAPVPRERGGAGCDLATLVAAQRRLAAYAPATALGVNMHLVWVEVARQLYARGIDTLDWVFADAATGEIFAFGISEAGNEAVLLDAQSTASPCEDGSYLISGDKIFTTLSPVWTRLGVHARCDHAAADSELIFGFVRRSAGPTGEQSSGTLTHPGEWNPLGMRATQSWNTRLDGVRIEARDIAARIAPWDANEPLVLAIFAAFSILTAAVYAGIGDRAIELASAAARREWCPPGSEFAPGSGTRLDDPETAGRLTRAVLRHRESLDALAILARDIDEQRARDDWFLALAAARNRVTDEARRSVEVAMRLTGAGAYRAESELARLYRDVLAGLFHPSSASALARTVRATFS